VTSGDGRLTRSPRYRVTIPAWVTFVLVVIASASPFLVVLDSFYPDFLVYRAGGQALLDHVPLYGPEFASRTPWGLSFTYPPFAAAAFIVFAYLPVSVGEVLDIGVGTAAFIVAAWVFQRHVGRGRVPRLLFPLCVGVGLMLEPLRKNLEMGQVNTILMALVTVDCLVTFKRLPRGVLVGLAAAIKLTPLVFLLYFVSRRDWRAVFSALATFLGLAFLSYLFSPRNSTQYWLHTLENASRIGALAQAWNQSLNGALVRLPLGAAEKPLWLLSALLVTVLGVLALRRCARVDDRALGILVTATIAVLISPVSWSHHWSWVGLFVIWCVNRTWSRRAAVEDIFFALVVAIFWIGPHWLVPSDEQLQPWAWWQHFVGDTYVFVGLAFLVAVAFGWGVAHSDAAGPGAAPARPTGLFGDRPATSGEPAPPRTDAAVLG
jgi:alpha-1,2-mannosyltransferase